MRQIRDDLWETEADAPFPGLTTHAYLWTPPSGGGVLLYSMVDDRHLDELAALGGVAAQYLSHQDEAGPMVARLAERFGSVVHAPAAERSTIEPVVAGPAVWLADHQVDDRGIEVVPTPGHSPGSTCYVVPGAGGARYLFTGDTAYRGADGRWRAGYLDGISDAAALADSLGLLRSLEPDLVASSAFAGDVGAHAMAPGEWSAAVDEALATLPAATRPPA